MSSVVKCLLCGEVLESKHRHDFQQCKCENLFIDGGDDYLRMGIRDGQYTVRVISEPDTVATSTPDDL